MAEWRWVPTDTPQLRQGGRTDDIWFVDDTTGWAVNSNGQILKTSDGAKTWVEQAHLPKVYLRCVTFASPTRGWVGTTTNARRLLFTGDGGQTWSAVTNLPAQPTAICGLCAVDENVVVAAGTNYPNRPTAFLRTTDGGGSWQMVDMTPHATLLVDVYFVDAQRGWVVGGKGGSNRDAVRPVVLATTDGGATWTNQVEAQMSTFPPGEWGWKIHFVNDQTGFVSLENFKDGAILRTDDGGMTWRRLPVEDPQGNANLEGIGFLDEHHGWVGGWGTEDFKGGFTSATDDGGATWRDANEVGRFLNRFRILGQPVRVAYASGDRVYRYAQQETPAPVREFTGPPADALVLNGDVEDFEDEMVLEVNVPAGTASLTVDLWDRFAGHVATVLDEASPDPGQRTIRWSGGNDPSALPGGVALYRVTADDRSASGIVRQGRASFQRGGDDGFVAQLRARLAERDGDRPALPLPAQEREAFHRLVNLEDFPEFRPLAATMARAYFAHADYGALELYGEFPYSPEPFDERLDSIFNAAVIDMHRPHPYDNDIITWSNGKQYRVGRASDDVVRDRLLQLAPFNLLDGAWLQTFAQARPTGEAEARLFSIWSDEAGNGEARKNHANVYRDLLQGLGIYLPAVTSRDFLDAGIVDSAWRAAVFQLAVGVWPQAFYSEILGMTLYLEWEATPTMMPPVRMLQRRGMNPLFYSLHMAIDNISEGHGALAKEAVRIHLDEVREHGGDRAVAESWTRVWNGYVTWATIGSLGADLMARRLIIDGKTIDVGTPDEPKCFPDWKQHHRDRMVNLVRQKGSAGARVHGRATIRGRLLNDLFATPEDLVNALVEGGLVDVERPRQSRLFELMEFEGPMFRVFNEDDQRVVLDWIESLAAPESICIPPLPTVPPGGSSAEQMVDVINAFAPLGRRAHDSLSLPDADGTGVPIIDLFDDPPRLMAALVRGGWVVPGQPLRSLFVTEILRDGPMAGVFDLESMEIVERWISDGAQQPPAGRSARREATGLDGEQTRSIRFTSARAFVGQGAVH